MELIHACVRSAGMELADPAPHADLTRWRIVSDRWVGDLAGHTWGWRREGYGVWLGSANIMDSHKIEGGLSFCANVWGTNPGLAPIRDLPIAHTEADLVRQLQLMELVFDQLTLTQHRKKSAWMTEKERAALEGAARAAKAAPKSKPQPTGQLALFGLTES